MRTDTPPPPMDEADEIQENMLLGPDIEIIEMSDSEADFDAVYDNLEDDIQDDSKLTFNGHSSAVFCCALDSAMQYAVSGGEDDKGFVWNLRTGETVLECTGHKDSVIDVGFNHDSTLVATADMGGLVQVWDVQNRTSVWDFETSDLRWLEWHHSSNVLLAGTADGNCWMWRIPGGETKTFQSFGSASSYGRIMPDGRRSVIGYDDGSVRFWDLKKASVIHDVVSPSSHSSSVTTIDCHQDNVMVLTGSTDCLAKLIKSNNGRVVTTFQCSAGDGSSGERIDSVESVGFFVSHPFVATGTLHGNLTIWDVPTQMQRQQCKLESAIVKLICDRAAPLVYTAGLDGMVRLYDGRTGQLEKEWGGHNAEILDFTLSRDGGTLLTASEDNTCKIFKVAQS